MRRMTCLDTVHKLGCEKYMPVMMFIEYLNTHSSIEHSRYLANLADLARLFVDVPL